MLKVDGPKRLLAGGSEWDDIRAVFDFTDVSEADQSGALLQWALARHLTVETARAGWRTHVAIARATGLSNDTVSNLLTGNRWANYRTLAVLWDALGPRGWPEPERLHEYMQDARLRSGGFSADGESFPSLYAR